MTAHELLRSWIRDDFGIDLVALDGVDAGADIAAAVWRGTAADGARYAVKWTGGGSPEGLRVPARLAALGVPGVAAPLPTRTGELWTEHDGRRLSLLPWVSDDDGLDGRMTRVHWESFGRLLAAVHDARVRDTWVDDTMAHAGTDAVAASATSESAATVIAAVDAVSHRLDGGGDGHRDDDLVRELGLAWRAGTDLLTQLRGRVTTLEQTVRERPGRPAVVCHTDAHLGNVLVGDGGDVWLIDWDDAAVAPRERDLMFVVGGLPGFAPVGEREQEWFFAGYGPADLDQELLSYYRGIRALDDIAQLATAVLDGPDERERSHWLGFARGELAGDGLAGLALRD
ncbi:phosphotransferase [Jiangella gansuensis]|uniref:phosphotransferase n=1 Tax=Jiangella gansuensis TaxID=281473 RepID=UPI00047EF68F|nr:phosphotransferase [Jiangella gansuensis]